MFFENMVFSAKSALRQRIKNILLQMTKENRKSQSDIITEKVLSDSCYRSSKRISIYLSTENEVSTVEILQRMFQDQKEVFVPTFKKDDMKMLRIRDMDDYDSLPMTKWNIKQPSIADTSRENPMLTAPLDLILVPGVAFTSAGGRCGQGMGYYDKYFRSYFDKYAKSHTVLIGLAFREQIVDEKQMPIDAHDYPMDSVITSDNCEKNE